MEKFFKKNWNLLVSTILGLLVIVFGLYKNHGFTETTRDGALAFVISMLITLLYRLNSYQQTLEDNQDLISKFIKLLAKKSRLAKTVELTHLAHDNNNQFYQFFLNKIFDEYNAHLQSISIGQYRCNADTELTLTKNILTCCNKCLKAISFQDEEWWVSNNGILYLEEHNKYIDRKKEKAIRIFIIDSTMAGTLKETFKKHLELKIETYILYSDLDHIEDKYKSDFVIYDDYMLRRGLEIKNIEGGKDALFTSDEVEVNKFLDLFNQIYTLAKVKNNLIPS